MPGKKIMKSFFNVYKDCIKLVELYECPDCTHCCTNAEIHFSYYEYTNINRIAKHELKKHAKMVKRCIGMEDLDEYKFNVIPCPFLEDKCTIYKERPFICKLYPISVDKAIIDNAISIDPCPLGINIILDYTAYIYRYLYNEEFALHLMNLKECLKQAENFKTLKDIPIIDIHLENIPDFLEYVKITPANVRKEERNQILKMLGDLSES